MRVGGGGGEPVQRGSWEAAGAGATAPVEDVEEEGEGEEDEEDEEEEEETVHGVGRGLARGGAVVGDQFGLGDMVMVSGFVWVGGWAREMDD